MFLAGAGDARRIQPIVSEVFADKKQPLPALSAIHVGALPLDGAQVIVESVSESKAAPARSTGLMFFAAQHADDARASLARLEAAAKSANIAAQDMLRVTCFLGSIDDAEPSRLAASRAFPSAAADFVQRLRVSAGPSADCEGVARGPNPAKLIFTSAQMAFGEHNADLRLAFDLPSTT